LTFDSIIIDYPNVLCHIWSCHSFKCTCGNHNLLFCHFLYLLDIMSTIYTHQYKTVMYFSLACVN
jgi:hypothetical protein